MTYDPHNPSRIQGHAELWHGRVTDPGTGDHAEIRDAQQRLLAKGSALSGRIEKERTQSHGYCQAPKSVVS